MIIPVVCAYCGNEDGEGNLAKELCDAEEQIDGMSELLDRLEAKLEDRRVEVESLQRTLASQRKANQDLARENQNLRHAVMTIKDVFK